MPNNILTYFYSTQTIVFFLLLVLEAGIALGMNYMDAQTIWLRMACMPLFPGPCR